MFSNCNVYVLAGSSKSLKGVYVSHGIIQAGLNKMQVSRFCNR